MKQRIRVVGIVKTADGVLLLKKTKGRAEELPSWELPTGKIKFGEQPEEAMARIFDEYLGIEVTKIELMDAITFVGLIGSSQLGNLFIIYKVEIDSGAKLNPTDIYSAYKYLKNEEFAAIRIADSTISVLEVLGEKIMGDGARVPRQTSVMEVAARSAVNGATVYVDGGSKGNPGPAAIGYYIVSEDGREIKRGGEFIGFATSRVAEYYAMKEGFEQAIELGLKRVRFIGDNLMIINQMKGIYPVKSTDLIPIYKDIQNMLPNFEAVAFVHVKRDLNQQADSEANKALLGHFSRKSNNLDQTF
ncbi:reverse transcriptase-like protein [Candidatus Saccharibacteria bacterium]|nr:reverse transcriptase-like protein [Candidatus Saccharibacteria bacterium]